MEKIIKYIKENFWAQIVGFYVIVICGAIVIVNLSFMPDRIDRMNENSSSRQELILTKKQNLVVTISDTASRLCDYDNIDNIDTCMSKVIENVQRVIDTVD